MTRPLMTTVARFAADLADAGRPDAELLGRFAADGDGTAFAALVRRHGPMVWGVCVQLLKNRTDADDAFQATFLALVRSARRLQPGPLGGWLHGAAVRVAKKIRRADARRRVREAKAAGPEVGRPVPDTRWDDLLSVVHDEVQRLPDGLRTAFVLCDLEGVPQADAAARLGWKPGTLTGRLSKARQRLLDRLTKQGFAPAAVTAIGVTTAGVAVPPELVGRVLSLAAAPNGASAAVSALVLEVTAMNWTRTKLIAAALMVAGGLGAGVGSGWVANAGAQSATGIDAAPPLPPANTPRPGEGTATRPAIDTSTGSMMREPSVPSPSAPRAWDYRYVSRAGGIIDFIKALESQAGEGWEYVETFNVQPNEIEELDKLARSSPEQFRLDRNSVGVALFRRPRRPGSVGRMLEGQNPESPRMMRGSGLDTLYKPTQPVGPIGGPLPGNPPMGPPPEMGGGDSGFSGKPNDYRSRKPAEDFVIDHHFLSHIDPVGLSQSIKQLLTGSRLSQVNVIAAPSGDGLLLSGQSDAVNEVKKLILTLDVPPKVKRTERPPPLGTEYQSPPQAGK